jgi:hypothetical protein
MPSASDCIVLVAKHAYTKAEVIARWGAAAWHAGTPPLPATIVLALVVACPPPATAQFPTPPVPPVGMAAPPPLSNADNGNAAWWPPFGFPVPQAPFGFGGGELPGGAFIPAFPLFGIITPGIVAIETTPVEDHPCQPAHHWDAALHECVEGTPLPPSIGTPEPRSAFILALALGALALVRRVHHG